MAELFANAVMHGPAGGRVLVGYCLWSKGARIVVCDGGGPSTPRLHHSTSLAEGGRGLQVVSSVAARWGSFRLAGSQVVWCDFGQPLRAPASDAWAWLRPVLPASILAAPASTAGQLPEAGLASPRGEPRPGVNAPMPAQLMTARLAPCGPDGDRASLLADDAPAAIHDQPCHLASVFPSRLLRRCLPRAGPRPEGVLMPDDLAVTDRVGH